MKTKLLKNKIIKCRSGLGIAIIALILLVISILLALITMLYAMTIIDNTPPQERLLVHKHHLWYNSTGGWFELGFAVTNNGGTDVFIEKITVRGQPCTWEKTYYWKTNTVGVSVELNVTTNELPDTQYADLSSIFKYGDGNFTRVSNGATLQSGWTIVFYIKDPPATYSHHTPPTLRVHTAITSYPKEIPIETVD